MAQYQAVSSNHASSLTAQYTAHTPNTMINKMTPQEWQDFKANQAARKRNDDIGTLIIGIISAALVAAAWYALCATHI